MATSQFDADEVLIRREANSLVITPKPRLWDGYFARARQLAHDFPDTIDDSLAQAREPF